MPASKHFGHRRISTPLAPTGSHPFPAPCSRTVICAAIREVSARQTPVFKPGVYIAWRAPLAAAPAGHHPRSSRLAAESAVTGGRVPNHNLPQLKDPNAGGMVS